MIFLTFLPSAGCGSATSVDVVVRASSSWGASCTSAMFVLWCGARCCGVELGVLDVDDKEARMNVVGARLIDVVKNEWVQTYY